MRNYNQLSYKELQKLMEYLNREKGFLFQSRPSYRGVAATATSVLLFNVTETNVRTAARLAGMTWKAIPERKPRATTLAKRDYGKEIEELRCQIQKLRNQFDE